ncbi:MAG: hypothetical protein WKF88_09300 [Ferruginibacter sp.]
MQEHLNSILLETGIEQADIDTILALPETAKDAKPEDLEKVKQALQPYIGKLHSTVATQVKNDPKFWEGLDGTNVNAEFKKKLEAEQYGRAANIVRQKTLKGLGLTEDDVKDLSDDDKNKLEVFVQKAAEKFSTTKSGDKATQQQLLEARKKLEDLELDIPTREEKIKQDYETRFNSEKLDFIILSELAGMKLKVPANYLLQKLSSELKEENAFVVNGLTAAPKQKANPALDILEGTKVLSLKDLIVKKLTADNLLAGDDKTDNKKSGVIEADVEPKGDGTLTISSHIADKIKARETAS